MNMAIHRIEDPALKTIEPLDVPVGWDDAYEYAMTDETIY
jgi:hypothetical protein